MSQLGFGSLDAARAMAARVKAATGHAAPIRSGGTSCTWVVELPPLRADEYEALRCYDPEGERQRQHEAARGVKRR